jgi:predicted nuclease of predicted toxin-antitoxin system
LRYLADQNISPLTVSLLADRGFDIRRVSDILPVDAADAHILDVARRDGFTIITQDLDFSSLIASRGETRPSLISLRLRNNRPEHIATVLEKLLPATEIDLATGAIVTVEDASVRVRFLPTP